ncbi:MAG: nucleotidyl transferase AbiEii/AbiGii toxin family protein [Acidimicrobiales bacterium]
MLTPLQEEVASVIGALPEAQEFVLAGGAALISRGDVDRHTEDLDFFGLDPTSVDRLLVSVRPALLDAGFEVAVVRASPGFARLSVERRGERTEVDLAADARLMAPELGPLGKILAGEELAIDKVLAVFGRAEARDFLALAAVEPGYGLAYLCSRATEKDPGFDLGVSERCFNDLDA